MKINKDYRYHIGTHANRISRAIPKQNQRAQASTNPRPDNFATFAKSMLTMAALANTIRLAQGTAAHEDHHLQRQNTSPTLNPKFILHNALKCTAALGTEHDVHAHLAQKSAAIMTTRLATAPTYSTVNLYTQPDKWQLRQPDQTCAARPLPTATILTIEQATPHRVARQATTSSTATTPAPQINSAMLVEINTAIIAALPKLFIEYVNQLNPFHHYQDIAPAFMGYIAHLTQTGKAQKAIFQDSQLQQALCQQLGLSCSSEADIYIKHLVSTLLQAIIESLDLTQAHNGISYNGYAFRGLQANPLRVAKKKARKFIQKRITQKIPHLAASTITKAAALLLKTIDPVLARIPDKDSLANKIRYCDDQCMLLTAGIEFVEQLVGDDANHYTLQSLIDIGRDYLLPSKPTSGRSSAMVERLNTPEELSLRDRILLKKASAGGITIDVTNTSATQQQLQTFLQQQHTQHTLAKAHYQLAQPMPTRQVIANKILKDHGFNPNQRIAYVNRMYSGRGGEAPMISYKSLTEAYMNKNIHTPQYDGDRAIMNRLPNLDLEFDQAFKAYSEAFHHALTTSIQLQLQQLAGQDKVQHASFKLFNANIHYVAGRHNHISKYASGSRPNYAALAETEAFFLEMKTQEGTSSHYIFTKQQISKGLQRLPENVPLEVSALAYQAQIIGDAAFNHIKTTHQKNAITRYQMTEKGDRPIFVTMTEIAAGNLAEITAKAAENFFEHNIKKLRDHAYEKTELQTANHFLKDFFRCLPFLQEIMCDKNWAQRTRHYIEDLAALFLPELLEAKLAQTEVNLIEQEAAVLTTKLQTSAQRAKPFLANSQQTAIAKKYPAISKKLAQANAALSKPAHPLSQIGHIRVALTSSGKPLLNQKTATLFLQNYAVDPAATLAFYRYSGSESIYTDMQNFYIKIDHKYYPVEAAEDNTLHIPRYEKTSLKIERTGNQWHLSLEESAEQVLKATDTQQQTNQRYQAALTLFKAQREFAPEDSTPIAAIPNYHADLSSAELKELFLKESTNFRQKSFLAKRISQVEQEELRSAALRSVLRHRNTFKNTDSLPLLMPQAFVLSIAGDNSGGRCYPLVNLMALAIIDGKTQQLNNQFFLAAADPEHTFINTLKELHANIRIKQVSLPVSGTVANLNKIIHRLAHTSPAEEMFAMDTATHSMLLGVHQAQGQKIFSFFDPNFGVVSYKNKAFFQKEVTQYLANKNYPIPSLSFRLLQLDSIRSWPLSDGRTVGQLLSPRI
jgi:hypothetical protein